MIGIVYNYIFFSPQAPVEKANCTAATNAAEFDCYDYCHPGPSNKGEQQKRASAEITSKAKNNETSTSDRGGAEQGIPFNAHSATGIS